MGCQVDLHTHTAACTHSNQGVGPDDGDWDMHTGIQMLVCNYAKVVEQMWGVRWTCIHVLMYVHILTKMWDQMRDDRVMHTEACMFVHNYVKGWNLCGESGGHAYMCQCMYTF